MLSAGESSVGIKSCGAAYWVLWVLTFVLLGTIEFFIGVYLVRDYRKREQAGFKFLETDIKWDKRTVSRIPLLCSLAGVGAGLRLSLYLSLSPLLPGLRFLYSSHDLSLSHSFFLYHSPPPSFFLSFSFLASFHLF